MFEEPIKERKIYCFNTRITGISPGWRSWDFLREWHTSLLGWGGLRRHMFILWNGRRNFSCFYNWMSLILAYSFPAAKDQLIGSWGNRKQYVIGNNSWLWCIFPDGKLERVQSFCIISFLCNHCWLLRTVEVMYWSLLQSSSVERNLPTRI